MLDLVSELIASLDADRDVAFCRLVDTRGSTPQKAGAAMLVFADGSQAGTLGGGCVEAEVKRRALAAMHEGAATVQQFMLDSDFGWDDGLICGGRMEVLIAPLGRETHGDYFRRLEDQLRQGRSITEVVCLADDAPSLLLFDSEQQLLAAVNESASQADDAKRHLQPLVDRPRPYVVEQMAFLPSLARCRLVIVGGGHVGKAVAELAGTLDFDVWIVDDRDEFVSADRFPTAQRRVQGPIDQVLPQLEITPETYCLIVTRGHNHDEQALFHLADRGARYVGMIGSRRKIRLIMDDLLEEGVSEEALQRVYAPVGLDIGSQTVPEIALSICAELVSHRNRQGEVPGRPAAIESPASS